MIYHLLRVLFTFIAFVNQRSMSTLLTYSNKTRQSEHGQDEVNILLYIGWVLCFT